VAYSASAGWASSFNLRLIPKSSARDPANRADAEGKLAEHLKLSPETAERTYRVLAHSKSGFTPDAEFDMDGFSNALVVRAETLGEAAAIPADPGRYLDLSCYRRAL